MGSRHRSHHIVSGCWLHQPRRPRQRATKGTERAKGNLRDLGNPRARQRPRRPRSQGKKSRSQSRKHPMLKRRKASFTSPESNSDPTIFPICFSKQAHFFLNPEPTDLETRFRIWVLQVEFVCIYLQQQIHYMHMRKKIDQLTLSNSHVQRYVTIYTYISNILPTFAFYIICIHIRSTSMSNTNAMCKYVCMCNLRRL